jgi:hypothetical protein
VPENRIGDLVVMLFVTWTGDMDEGERAIAPLRALAEPIVDTMAPIPYPEIYNYTAELTERHGVVVRQMFADSFGDEAIDAVLEAMGRATSPMSLAHFRGQGGAIANVASDATAFAHRTQKYFVAAIAVWPDASDATPHEEWTLDLWQRIRPEGNGVYVNFLANEGPERIGEAYPAATMRRLREVKTKYDPANMFRYNQNIRPLE